jgi:hypothetical protein
MKHDARRLAVARIAELTRSRAFLFATADGATAQANAPRIRGGPPADGAVRLVDPKARGSWAVQTLAAALVAIGLWLAGGATAHALDCGMRLVTPGDAMYYVQTVCGPPDSVSTDIIPIGGLYGRRGTLTVVVWVYDFGPSRTMEELRFENGVLRTVRSLGPGTRYGAPPRGDMGHRSPRASRRRRDSAISDD